MAGENEIVFRARVDFSGAERDVSGFRSGLGRSGATRVTGGVAGGRAPAAPGGIPGGAPLPGAAGAAARALPGVGGAAGAAGGGIGLAGGAALAGVGVLAGVGALIAREIASAIKPAIDTAFRGFTAEFQAEKARLEAPEVARGRTAAVFEPLFAAGRPVSDSQIRAVFNAELAAQNRVVTGEARVARAAAPGAVQALSNFSPLQALGRDVENFSATWRRSMEASGRRMN